MATFNIENTIPAGTYHKRSTGMTGQIIASAELSRKLERVEELYHKVYGTKIGRYNFYKMVLPHAREGKADVGGYLQYMAQDVAGIFLDAMHKALSAQAKRKKYRDVIIDVGTVEAYNLKDLARGKRGPAKKVA